MSFPRLAPLDPETLAAYRERLRELVIERALRTEGEFTLASGQRSPFYVDGKQISLSPEGMYLFAELILDRVPPEAEAIGGLTLGADPIVGAVVALSHLRGRPLIGFIVRKEPKAHGTRRSIEGPLPEGARVVIVEDVITTAGSALKAMDRVVEEAGASVVKVIALVDRQEGGRENLAARGAALDAIFTRQDLGVA